MLFVDSQRSSAVWLLSTFAWTQGCGLWAPDLGHRLRCFVVHSLSHRAVGPSSWSKGLLPCSTFVLSLIRRDDLRYQWYVGQSMVLIEFVRAAGETVLGTQRYREQNVF